MPVMHEDDHTTEEPAADPREEQTAEPHADIVARLLEYQRRVREETGAEPASSEHDRTRRARPKFSRPPPRRPRPPRRHPVSYTHLTLPTTERV